MRFTRRDGVWAAACTALVILGAIQAYRAEDLRVRLKVAEARPFWPDRATPAEVSQADRARFTPTERSTIPDPFWGEFAEDAGDCGGEGTILVKAAEIVSPETRQRIARIRWTAPRRVQVEVSEPWSGPHFGMDLSEDGDEITFVYSNRKRVVQRCSARAESPPKALTSPYDSAADLNLDADLMDETISLNVD